MNEAFGPHLTLDLSNCNKEKLKSLDFIFKTLYDLPNVIGMTKITQPHVFPYSGLIPEDKGVTGFVVIAESHISIHTFEQKDFVFIDVFSCKNFDVDLAAKYLIDEFEAKSVEKNIVLRGKSFPRESKSCTQKITKQDLAI